MTARRSKPRRSRRACPGSIAAWSVDFGKVADLALRGPMIAVGKPADPPPWRALSYAPLAGVAEAYAHAGAEVRNVPGCGGGEAAA